MKPVLLLLILGVLLSCNKKEEVAPVLPKYKAPDFALIPTKNAKWHIRAFASQEFDHHYYIGPGINLAGLKDYLRNE